MAIQFKIKGMCTLVGLIAIFWASFCLHAQEKGAPPFKSQGPAPELTGITHWLNSKPLTIKDLKGKVVLVDFWTYSCINCIRTFPYLESWYDKYKKDGFVLIGVHSPEFPFEKSTANLESAIKRFNIDYPVAQDNNFATWRAYKNHYWPGKYLIDQQGNIVYSHFGEGDYEKTENAIRTLLGMHAISGVVEDRSMMKAKTPEIYFGLNRLQFLDPSQTPAPSPTQYRLPKQLPPNTFALSGSWKFEEDKAVLVEAPGTIQLHFNAGRVFMVAASPQPNTATVWVDGKQVNSVTIQQHQLYVLFESSEYKEHLLEVRLEAPGLEAYTFTFG